MSRIKVNRKQDQSFLAGVAKKKKMTGIKAREGLPEVEGRIPKIGRVTEGKGKETF